jgi:hypothetical protein
MMTAGSHYGVRRALDAKISRSARNDTRTPVRIMACGVRHPLFVMSREARHHTMMTTGSHYGVRRVLDAKISRSARNDTGTLRSK